MRITVVGAGVIGLTTAFTLEEQGHDVRIVAVATGPYTTSAVAGAVWFPYRAGPPAKVAAWAASTRTWLEELAADPEAGIDILTGYEITPETGVDAPVPWWAANIEVTRAPAPVTGSPLAWKFRAPRVEPSKFMPWLTARLRAPIIQRAVVDLAAEDGDLVINCSGLGARELANDELIYPLFGQIVISDVGTTDLGVSVTDHRDADQIFYVIPRRDELVLGGCSVPWPPGAAAPIDADITARILEQARTHGVPIGRVRTERTGLRPYRLEVRLERAGRIIHNYGHGGAGFTLCRGCAVEVASLVRP